MRLGLTAGRITACASTATAPQALAAITGAES
jgi:hypothetical protein